MPWSKLTIEFSFNTVNLLLIISAISLLVKGNSYLVAAFAFFAMRDFLRAAVFQWNTPLRTAESIVDAKEERADLIESAFLSFEEAAAMTFFDSLFTVFLTRMFF